MSQRPNMAYLAQRGGTIVFRALCAGDERGMTEALEFVARGDCPSISESRRRLGPIADGIGSMRAMTRLAGSRAVRDIWRAVPPIAALAWLADAFAPLPPRWRVAAALGAVALVASTVTGRRDSRMRSAA